MDDFKRFSSKVYKCNSHWLFKLFDLKCPVSDIHHVSVMSSEDNRSCHCKPCCLCGHDMKPSCCLCGDYAGHYHRVLQNTEPIKARQENYLEKSSAALAVRTSKIKLSQDIQTVSTQKSQTNSRNRNRKNQTQDMICVGFEICEGYKQLVFQLHSKTDAPSIKATQENSPKKSVALSVGTSEVKLSQKIQTVSAQECQTYLRNRKNRKNQTKDAVYVGFEICEEYKQLVLQLQDKISALEGTVQGNTKKHGRTYQDQSSQTEDIFMSQKQSDDHSRKGNINCNRKKKTKNALCNKKMKKSEKSSFEKPSEQQMTHKSKVAVRDTTSVTNQQPPMSSTTIGDGLRKKCPMCHCDETSVDNKDSMVLPSGHYASNGNVNNAQDMLQNKRELSKLKKIVEKYMDLAREGLMNEIDNCCQEDAKQIVDVSQFLCTGVNTGPCPCGRYLSSKITTNASNRPLDCEDTTCIDADFLETSSESNTASECSTTNGNKPTATVGTNTEQPKRKSLLRRLFSKRERKHNCCK